MAGRKRAVEKGALERLGVEIRRLRREAGLSLAEAAAILGVSKNYLGKAERGGTLLSYPRLRQLAGYYEQRPERLLAILGLPEFDFLAQVAIEQSVNAPALGDELSDLTTEERQELVNYLGYIRFRRNQPRAAGLSVSERSEEL
jgi:transcriptional regulator with XRE-family HTH domain